MDERGRILIVDDDRLFRKSVLKVLTDEGYEITEAKSGKEGLNLINNNTFDIILSDYRMSDIDGIQMVNMIKEFNHSVIAILITAFDDSEILKKAKESGFYSVIYKPVDMDNICKIIKEALHNADKGARN
jgi:DNA-binding NtrC family response regulator